MVFERCCGSSTPEERRKRKLLFKYSVYQCLITAIPVAIAASVSAFVISLIDYVSEDAEHPHHSMIGLKFLYAALGYLINKFLTFKVRKQEYEPNPNSSVGGIWKFVEEQKLTALLCNIFAETTGFAWKEFLVTLILEVVFLEHSWGSAFGLLLLWVLIFAFIIFIGRYIHAWLGLDEELNMLLQHFDAECFPFSIAYILTVLLALGSNGLGFHYISEHSSLLEWKSEAEGIDDDDGGSTSNNYLFMYSFVVTALTLTFMVLEEEYTLWKNKKSEEASLTAPIIHSESERGGSHQSHKHSESEHGGSHQSHKQSESERGGSQKSHKHEHGHHVPTSRKLVTTLGYNPHLFSAFTNALHNFIGYFSGVTYFTLFVDNFVVASGGDKLSVFISASVVIAFLNYKAPSCITGSIISGQRREEKLAAQTITESESETTPSWWSRCWDTTVLYYRRISRLRSYIIITAVRLTVGWYWEIWLASFFTLVTEEDNLTEKENIGINLIIAIIIILVAFSAHYCIKEWGDYDLLAVEEAQEEGQGQQELTATTSVDNPIQSEAMTDRDNSTVAKTSEA